jgi:hypothetical protein
MILWPIAQHPVVVYLYFGLLGRQVLSERSRALLLRALERRFTA